MQYRITAACTCNRGRVRANNEDNLYFFGRHLTQYNDGMERTIECEGSSHEPCCFAVFDGMGGESDGEMASYFAVSILREKLKQVRYPVSSPRLFLLDTCRQMNRAICKETEKRKIGQSGSTAALLFFQDEQVYACNIGDSPIFRLRKGCLLQVSKDHITQLDYNDRGVAGRKPMLTQCLGIPEIEMQIEPYVAKGILQTGDCYLICSDGLTDMVTKEEIAEIITKNRDVKNSVQILLKLALKRGGRDNITMILCMVSGLR